MASAYYDINAQQYSTFNFFIEYQDGNGNPVDLSGYTARLQVRPSATSGRLYLHIDNDGIATGGTAGEFGVTGGFGGVGGATINVGRDGFGYTGGILFAADAVSMGYVRAGSWKYSVDLVKDGRATEILNGQFVVAPKVTQLAPPDGISLSVSQNIFGNIIAFPANLVYTFNGSTGDLQGVSGAYGGDGITVSGATGNVVFTNTGVTRAVAGTGISISSSTGTVTITNIGASLGTNTFSGLQTSPAGFSGPITGTVTGNASTATALQTPRQINGTTFDGTSGITTGYWGYTRTVTIGQSPKAVDGSSNVSWTLAEIGGVTTSNANTFVPLQSFSAGISASGATMGSAMVLGGLTAGTANFTGTVTVGATFTVNGNLVVNGTETVLNTTTLSVDDKNIVLADTDTPSDVSADGGGITLRGTTDKTLYWRDTAGSGEASAAWNTNQNLNLTSSGSKYYINGVEVLSGNALGSGVTGSSLTSVGTVTQGLWSAGISSGGATLSGNIVVGGNGVFAGGISAAGSTFSGLVVSPSGFSGPITGTVTGNASTATALQTPRQINGTAFDGTAGITTAYWGTTRTLTIGQAPKAVDGGSNVSWTLAEIGGVTTSNANTFVPLQSFAGGISAAGATLSGTVTALTQPVGTNNSTLATTAFVQSEIVADTVTSVNGSTGAITDVARTVLENTFTPLQSFNGGISAAGATLSGIITAPTPPVGDNSTRVATTAYVQSEIANEGVTSFNGLTGTVQGVSGAYAGDGISLSGTTGNVTFTNTGVTRAVAGDGIAVSGSAGTVTFSNTGVTRAVAGVGISVSANSGTVTITNIGASLGTNTFSGLQTAAAGFSGPLTGNASTATALQTPRNINGTAFDGTAGITTAYWGSTRTITIGQAPKAVDGGSNVSWTLEEIGGVTTSNKNIFVPLQSFASGISASGATFSGIVNAPTPPVGDNSTRLATTAYVQQEIANEGVTSFNGLTGAVQGVSGAYAGDGISLSGATGNVTFTNTGVTRAVAGTGIALTANTGTVTITNIGASLGINTFSGLQTSATGFSGPVTGEVTGNASTATALKTARNINGTAFDGTSGITTAYWGNSRTLTIGQAAKAVDGGGNVSWTLAEIGGVTTSNANTFVPLQSFAGGISAAGATLSGTVTAPTQPVGTNNTTVATTAFVQSEIVADTVTSFNGATGSVQGVSAAVAGDGITISGATGAVTFTNAGVTRAVAGTGISVSANTGTVQVSNTGVLSFNSVTGNVQGVSGAYAGDGISVTGNTGNVTFTNTGVTRAVAGTGIALTANTGTVTITNIGASLGTNTFSGLQTAAAGFSGPLTGNASSATALQTPQQINGTAFNGTAGITTAYWGTTRTLTIGQAAKAVDGGGNVSWTLAEIGGVTTSNTNTFVPLQSFAGGISAAGATLSGTVTAPTQPIGTNNTTVATTSFVQNEIVADTVTSVNGATGAITDVARTVLANTFTPLQSFSAGISGSGATFGNVRVTGGFTGEGAYFGGDVGIGATLTVSGNLVVNGTQTVLNTTTLSVDDKNITLGDTDSPSPTDTTADGGGITLRGTTDKTLYWKNTSSGSDVGGAWNTNQHLNLSGADRKYYIDGAEVLGKTALGSGVVGSALTSTGTVTSGLWSSGISSSNGITFSGTVNGATASFSGLVSSTRGFSGSVDGGWY